MTDFLKRMIREKIFSIDDDGIKLFKKISYSAMPSETLARILQKIGEAKGWDFLYQLGYDAGIEAGKEMMKHMKLYSKIIPSRLKLIQHFMEMIGFGKTDFVIYDVKKRKILVRVTNHPVIEDGKRLFGSDCIICGYYLGVYSAHSDRELKIKGTKGIETQCICKGAKFCEWSFGVF